MKKIFTLAMLFHFSNNVSAQCWKAVSAGGFSNIAQKADGSLWTWGSNEHNCLGDGTAIDRWEPVKVASGDWKMISAGDLFNAAIKSDNTLWVWGSNAFGQLGDGTFLNRSTPGKLGTASNWQYVSGGSKFLLAIKTDGTLWACGDNSSGAIASFPYVSIANLFQIGTAKWKMVCGGSEYTMGIQTDGSLWGWGQNMADQLGTGGPDTNVPTQVGTAKDWKTVSAGSTHTLAIKTDGSLWAWGSNSFDALGDGTSIDRPTPVKIGTDNTWVSVFASQDYSLGLKSDGTLWGWGSNGYGQLGMGPSVTYVNKPTQIGTAKNWTSIEGGFLHSVALKSDGTVWTSGENSKGQLGDASTTWRDVYCSVNCWSSSVKESLTNNNSVTVAPNPFSFQTTISFNNEAGKAFELRVCNAIGQVVIERKDIRGNSATIERGALNSGLYYYTLSSDGMPAANGKLVVQ